MDLLNLAKIILTIAFGFFIFKLLKNGYKKERTYTESLEAEGKIPAYGVRGGTIFHSSWQLPSGKWFGITTAIRLMFLFVALILLFIFHLLFPNQSIRSIYIVIPIVLSMFIDYYIVSRLESNGIIKRRENPIVTLGKKNLGLFKYILAFIILLQIIVLIFFVFKK